MKEINRSRDLKKRLSSGHAIIVKETVWSRSFLKGKMEKRKKRKARTRERERERERERKYIVRGSNLVFF